MPRGRRLTPEAQEKLRREQANLTALYNHPSWDDLVHVVEVRTREIEKQVLAEVLGSLGEIDVKKLYRLRGYVAGMSWFAAVPARAESSLRSYLEGQGIRMEGVER